MTQYVVYGTQLEFVGKSFIISFDLPRCQVSVYIIFFLFKHVFRTIYIPLLQTSYPFCK